MTEEELLLRVKTELDAAGFTDAEAKADGLSSKLSGAGKAAGVGMAAIGTAAVGAGAALLGVGMKFDDAFDGMAVKTGATGKDLEGLQESFKNVIGNTPADFETVSAAMGTLSQRTGATGKDLEALTTQVADLSRITGTDATAAATAAADVFAKWGTSGKDQGAVMDQLFKASQETGIGFEELAASVTTNASALQAGGLSMRESIGLVSQLKGAGVDASEVMPKLGKAMAAMVKDGQDPAEGLADLFETIKAEGPNSATAIEKLGPAGLKLAAGIAAGKVELGAFSESLANSKGAISDTAANTADFGEKVSLFKNKLMVALEPAGTALMDGLTSAFEKIEPHLPAITAGISSFVGFLVDNPTLSMVVGVIAGIGGAFGAIVAFVAPVIPIVTALFGGISAAIGVVVPIIGGFVALLSGPVILVIGAVVAAVAIWMNYGDVIKEKLSELGDFIVTKWTEFKTTISDAIEAIGIIIAFKWAEFKLFIFTTLSGIALDIFTKWTEIKTSIMDALEVVRVFISAKWDAIKEYLTGVLAAVGKVVTDAWDAIKAVIQTALSAVQDKVNEVWTWVGDFIHEALNKIQDVFNSVMDWIADKTGISMDTVKDAFDDAITVVHDIVDVFISFFTGDWEGMFDAIQRVADNSWTAIKNIFSRAWENLKALLSIDEFVANFKTGMARLEQIGGDLIEGLKRGISKGWDTLSAWMRGLFGDLVTLAKKILGIASPSAVMRDEVGIPIGQGIVAGVAASLAGNPIGDLIVGWAKASSGASIGASLGATLRAAVVAGLLLSGPTNGGALIEGKHGGWDARAKSADGRMGLQKGAGITDTPGGEGVTASGQRGGIGGLLAASKSNYWRVFVNKWGVPTEASARKTAAYLGIPLPDWLEAIYHPPAGETVGAPDPLNDPAAASEAGAAIKQMTKEIGDFSAAVAKVTTVLIDLGALKGPGPGSNPIARPLPEGPGIGGPIVIEPPPGGEVRLSSVELGNIVFGPTIVQIDGKTIARSTAEIMIEDVTILDKLGKALGKRKAIT